MLVKEDGFNSECPYPNKHHQALKTSLPKMSELELEMIGVLIYSDLVTLIYSVGVLVR